MNRGRAPEADSCPCSRPFYFDIRSTVAASLSIGLDKMIATYVKDIPFLANNLGLQSLLSLAQRASNNDR